MVLKINGDIVGNDAKEMYKWFKLECTTPGDVRKAFAALPKGDRLQVKINSGGGNVNLKLPAAGVLQCDYRRFIQSVSA